MDSKKVGLFISERRKDFGLTQQQLAERLGVSNKAISKWETGEGYPDITIILDLSKALCVTADELLNGEMLKRSNGLKQNDTDKQQIVINENTPKNERQNSKAFRSSFKLIIFGIMMFILMSIPNPGDASEGLPFWKNFIGFVLAIVMIIGGIFVELAYMKKQDML